MEEGFALKLFLKIDDSYVSITLPSQSIRIQNVDEYQYCDSVVQINILNLYKLRLCNIHSKNLPNLLSNFYRKLDFKNKKMYIL